MMIVQLAKKSLAHSVGSLICPSLLLFVVLYSFAAPARCQQLSFFQDVKGAASDPLAPEGSGGGQQPQPGNIRGEIIDQSGVTIAGALVKLTREGQTPSQEVESDEEGQFFFFNIDPGPFQLTITSEGLASQTISGTLQPGESCAIPRITLAVATQVTEVRVGLPPDELAEEQIKEQEKQRVFGFVPNFFVSYEPNAAPLPPRLKFRLAWKSATDPVTLAGVGVLAGINQAADRWGAYGQGAQGYAKRYGATYADVFTATFLGGAVFPSVLKQDPRYFYKGTGSKRSRFFYAIANSIICKGDNGKWQPNYSNVVGSLAAAGVANLYYPPNDRRGASLVISTALVRLGETSLAAVLQEFVFPKLTSSRSMRVQAQP